MAEDIISRLYEMYQAGSIADKPTILMSGISAGDVTALGKFITKYELPPGSGVVDFKAHKPRNIVFLGKTKDEVKAFWAAVEKEIKAESIRPIRSLEDGVQFLTEQQIWGDDRGNGQLQVMKSYGTKTGMSDLAIALGGYMGSDTTSDNQRSGYVWSASSDGVGYVRGVRVGGDRDGWDPDERRVAARPALPSSIASSIKPSDVSPGALAKGEARLGKPIKDADGNVIWSDVILYGEYPQTIAPDNVTKKLEQGFSKSQLKATGKKYTFDGEKYDAYGKPFQAKEYAEYEHRGKRYIRVEAQPYDSDSVMSNGKMPKKGEACWIEVQPIEWLKDPSGVMVARQALFAGVQFDRNQSYDGNFDKTDMKQYLDKIFAKEVQADRNVATSAAAVGPRTAAVTARRGAAALDDPCRGNK